MKNPWAEVGNQAVNALYKSYMTQPSQADIQQAQLKTRLLDAQVGTENARQNKIGLEAGMLQDRRGVPSQLAKLYGEVYAPMQKEGDLPSTGVGPGAPIEAMPDQNTVTNRFMQNLPGFAENAARFTLDNPNQFADVFAPFIGGAGAPQKMFERAQMGAGTDYANTMSGVRENNAADLNQALSVQGLKNDAGFTLSPGAGRYDAQGNEIAQQPFKEGGGSYIEMPDGTVVSIDGGMPYQAGKTERGRLEGGDRSLESYQVMSEMYRDALVSNPSSPGTRGNLARMANGVLGQVKDLNMSPELTAQLQTVQDSLAGQFIDPATGQVMNEDLYAASTIANVLPFAAASAITGSSGRSLSDQDRQTLERTIGTPESWFATSDKLVSRLNQVDELVLRLREKYQGRMSGTILTPDSGFTDGGVPPVVPSITPDIIDNMTEEELDAFLAGE
jgi:hypothetical protein